MRWDEERRPGWGATLFDAVSRVLDVIEVAGLDIECIVGVYPSERDTPLPLVVAHPRPDQQDHRHDVVGHDPPGRELEEDRQAADDRLQQDADRQRQGQVPEVRPRGPDEEDAEPEEIPQAQAELRDLGIGPADGAGPGISRPPRVTAGSAAPRSAWTPRPMVQSRRCSAMSMFMVVPRIEADGACCCGGRDLDTSQARRRALTPR